jgi:hypothetical protein
MRVRAIIAGLGLVGVAALAAVATQVWAGEASAQAGTARPDAAAHVSPDTTTPLTADEAAGLQYMREEEKLAQDVYARLGAACGARVFTNITRSEAKHTATVKVFLDAFGIADPAAGRTAGSYESDELQALYAQLVGQGAASFKDAVNVGIAVEKRDIADLQARIAATDRADLRAMYGNLLRASQNHLRAFQRQLSMAAGAGRSGGHGQGHGGGN